MSRRETEAAASARGPARESRIRRALLAWYDRVARPLPWRALDDMRLRYYAPRRTRSNKGNPGWMTLKLSAGARKLTIDSTLDGFDDIAARASRAAMANGLELSEVTLSNLAALGFAPDGESRIMALAAGESGAGRGGSA